MKYGNQGANWQNAKIEIELEPPVTAIFFEVNIDDWNYGDIAIDDILFRKSSCNGIFKLFSWYFI